MSGINHILLLAIILICVSCLQNPAPVLLKGEEFHGKKSIDSKEDYSLIRDSVFKKKMVSFGEVTVKEVAGDRITINKKKCHYMMPVEGVVISQFSGDDSDTNKDCNDGIKIAVDNNFNVKAAGNGKVLYVGKGLRWYGNLIIIEHDDNIITLYSFLNKINVEAGNEVKRGQTIASISKTTDIEGMKPHICFTMRRDSVAVNPLLYIDCAH